ncbi:MAG: flavin reductase [Bacteroidetes bacterium]|nr:flavin reductase [Bacteroidota bacterium]
MKKSTQHNFYTLDTSIPIWERMFIVAPLIVIGTREGTAYDLAPKHMATPIGFDNYFGFVCTPKHATYQNIKENKEFTVSFPLPDQVVLASLSASPRCNDISKSKAIVEALSTIKATTVDALFISESYLYLECKLFKIIDGFNENSIITGKIVAAHVDKNHLKESDKDEQQQLKENPLLAYIAYGRFAKISETYNFPFPKNFKR